MTALRRSTIFLLSLVAVALLAAAGYTWWWIHLAAQARTDLANWANERTALGWTVETGDVTIHGFPWSFRLTMAAPALTDAHGAHWQGPPLTVTLAPYSPTELHVEFAGHHVIALNGIEPFEIALGGASADMVVHNKGLTDLSMDLAEIQVPGADLAQMTLNLKRTTPKTVNHTTISWLIDAELSDLKLAEQAKTVLGDTVKSARLKAHLMGSILAAPFPGNIAAWRDEGGILEVDDFAVTMPPLSVHGKGTLALDREMQPIFSSVCTVRGLLDTMDTLVKAGNIPAQDAAIARIVLGLLTKPGKDGVPELSVPVSLQDRQLYVGTVPLAVTPALSWPEIAAKADPVAKP